MTINNFNPQSGRSMVEMLGVLAVIGVLSIGGIMGYSYGMDKYRANETINDIMLKSIDIVTNINQDKVPDASSWLTTNPIGYPLSFVQDIPNDRYGIQIQNVPSRVCKMVGDALKNLAIVYVGSEDYTPETENDPCDLSDKNTMEFYFESLTCEPACDSHEICLWGECVRGYYEHTPWKGFAPQCEQDSDCGPCGECPSWSSQCVPKNSGTACITDTGKEGLCQWNECLPKTGCNDTKPCTGKHEYCASPNTSCTEPFPDGATGVCVKADFVPLTVDETEYWVARSHHTWWDADAACKALGFNGLMDVETLQKNTSLLMALRQHYMSYIWTSSMSGSCHAMDVYGWDMNIHTDRAEKHSSYLGAVCQ